jgi:hypothetical protein
MSANITLRYTKEHNSFTAYYFDDFMRRWFDLQAWNEDDHSRNPILFGAPFACDTMISSLERGCKIIVDNLQEATVPDLSSLIPWADQVIILTGSDQWSPHFKNVNVFEWFWYFESAWYHDRGYSNYRPSQCQGNINFLMPMRLQKRARDQMVALLQCQLDKAIWSYVAQGRRLPGIPAESLDDQRWFEPSWYDSTCFSLVNESSCEDDEPLFWTEKTCKPLAFFHPFLLVSRPGLLAKLREFGFETWPELFDESYDTMPLLQDRMCHIVTQVQQFDPERLHQPSVQHKLKHNHDRFFDLELVYGNIEKRVISPILDFLQTGV